MSLVARYLEERGLPTLCMASALDIVEAGNPPRAVFVDYPLGHTAGKPFDPADQYSVMQAAIRAFADIGGPGGLVRLPNRWAQDDAWKSKSMDSSAGDQRSPRDTTPQYQYEEDRLLAEENQAGG